MFPPSHCNFKRAHRPTVHLYSDFAQFISIIWFWIRHFLISTYLMVYFGNLGPFDDGMGEMGGPWWHNDKWDPLITWWEIRGHNGGPLDDTKMDWDPLITWWELEVIILMTWWGNWGPWWRNGNFRALCPLMTQWGNWKPLIKQWRNCGELNDLRRKTGNWAPDDAMEHLFGGLWWCSGQIRDSSND